MTKNKYKHFNPQKHNLAVKIATVRSGHHCKHNINYHIIWIPKYRKKILSLYTPYKRVKEILLNRYSVGEIKPPRLEILDSAKSHESYEQSIQEQNIILVTGGERLNSAHS